MPPLPWRKKSRISRLVADLQSPPKHGGSLVVETGFPTSLIDLVVKNSDRLKKPSKKKKKGQYCEELEISDPVLTSLLPYREYDTMPASSTTTTAAAATATAMTSSVVKKESVMERKDRDDKKSNIVSHNCGYDSKSIVVLNEHDNSNGCDQMDVKSILIAVFKVFLVVVLGLSTKRLVVGFTMSAFLLLLLEYVGGRSLSSLRPCCKAREYFERFFERVFVFVPKFSSFEWNWGCLESPKLLLIDQEKKFVLSDSCPSSRDGEIESLSPCPEEIQVLDSNLDRNLGSEANLGVVLGIKNGDAIRGSEVLDTGETTKSIEDEECRNKEILESEDLKMKSIQDDEGYENEILGSENPKRCKKGKLKSKIIKTIVPKKLWHLKKGKKENGPHTANELVTRPGEDCTASCEKDDTWQGDNELEKNVSSIAVEMFQQKKQDNNGVDYNCVVLKTESSRLSRDGLTSEVMGNGGRERNSKLKFWVVLLLVLAGLLVGRLLPLLLTVLCFIGKVIGTLRR